MKFLVALRLTLLLGSTFQAEAWTYDIYGICNYYNTSVAFYEYDNTFLASAGANLDPYTQAKYGTVDGDYHHIFQCDHESCFSDNNLRVYRDNDNIPNDGMLATFWTNDNTAGYNIQACGYGITGNDYHFGWEEDSSDCWTEGQSHNFDSSHDDYVIKVDIDAKVSFVPGKGQDACPGLPRPSCTAIKNATGQWTAISTAPVNQTVTLSEGVTHGYSDEASNTWGYKVSATVSAGFTAGSEGGWGASVSVTGETSSEVSKSYTSTFSATTISKFEYNFPPGVVWQFQFAIIDECGTSTASRRDLTITQSEIHSPCCLPGFFKDIEKPLGECLPDPKGQVVNMCRSGEVQHLEYV